MVVPMHDYYTMEGARLPYLQTQLQLTSVDISKTSTSEPRVFQRSVIQNPCPSVVSRAGRYDLSMAFEKTSHGIILSSFECTPCSH